MTRRPAAELRDPFSAAFEPQKRFFTAKDIQKLFGDAGITRPENLHDAKGSVWAHTPAERAAMGLSRGLLSFVSQTRRREIAPNASIRRMAGNLKRQTDAVLAELGLSHSLSPPDPVVSPNGHERWALGKKCRLGVFSEVAQMQQVELVADVEESLRIAFGDFQGFAPEMLEDPMLLRPFDVKADRIPLGSSRIGGAPRLGYEEIRRAIHSVIVLNALARETIEFYPPEDRSKAGPKGTVRYFTFAAMEAFELLTGEDARIYIVAPTKKAGTGKEHDPSGQRFGNALDFVQCALLLAKKRLEDGSIEEDGIPMNLERFRDWLKRTAKQTLLGPPLEPHFREYNDSKGRDVEAE